MEDDKEKEEKREEHKIFDTNGRSTSGDQSAAISVDKAQELKTLANEIYRKGDFDSAVSAYTRAFLACPKYATHLQAILLCNRAACHQQYAHFDAAIQDCTDAIALDGSYAKAYMRRFRAYEGLLRWHDALSDLNKAMELDDKFREDNVETHKRVERESKEQFEKEKTEMMGKMKDFGNFLLGKVGLSTDNFCVQQNESGSYNIQFQPNQPPNKS